MQKIKPETLRRMKWAWGLMLVGLAFPAIKTCIDFPPAMLIVVPVLFAGLLLVVYLNQPRRFRYLSEREKWKQEYRASPESHLLRLSDSE